MVVMTSENLTSNTDPILQDLGVTIRYNDNPSSRWKLDQVTGIIKPARKTAGCVVFLVQTASGMPMDNIDVLLVWADGLTSAWTVKGRARIPLYHLQNPKSASGPYWCSLLDIGSPEVHGLGLLKMHWVEYQLVYTRAIEP